MRFHLKDSITITMQHSGLRYFLLMNLQLNVISDSIFEVINFLGVVFVIIICKRPVHCTLLHTERENNVRKS